jgi:hypothetical protein
MVFRFYPNFPKFPSPPFLSTSAASCLIPERRRAASRLHRVDEPPSARPSLRTSPGCPDPNSFLWDDSPAAAATATSPAGGSAGVLVLLNRSFSDLEALLPDKFSLGPHRWLQSSRGDMGASPAVVHDAHDTSSGKDLNPIVNAWVDVLDLHSPRCIYAFASSNKN